MYVPFGREMTTPEPLCTNNVYGQKTFNICFQCFNSPKDRSNGENDTVT
jgi:hypothetical protein